MNFKLPTLKYQYADFAPYIDAKTMEIHHSKHHQGYVDNLNAGLTKFYPAGLDSTLHQLLFGFHHLPNEVKTAVQNHGGGHANHSLFWEILTPHQKPMPQGLLDQINQDFGSFAAFQEAFNTAAKTRFGSGWAWLVYDETDKLSVISTANQDSPLMDHKIPVLGLDVWEHAYYLNYQNKRADYVNAFWNLIDWSVVAQKLEEAKIAFSFTNPHQTSCC